MDSVRIILRFHSLFYTPHFAAMHLGVFERQQLGVEVRTAKSGGELASALMQGKVELGLRGPIRGLDLEVWQRMLNSGCRIEARQLATGERLPRGLTLDSLMAWRVF